MEKHDDLEIGDVSQHDSQGGDSTRQVQDISTRTKENEGGKDDNDSSDTDSEVSADDAEELLDDPLDIVPPNFDKAKKHQDATRVKNIAEDVGEVGLYDTEEDFCECCHLPTSKAAPPFKICTSVFSLEDLGSGFPLYYQFKKFIFLVYLVMILVFGIYAIITNLDHDNADQWIEEAVPTPILKHTMGNRGVLSGKYNEDELDTQIFLNFVVIIIILVIANLLRWRQLAIEKKIDEKNITPADFTCYVVNLPLESTQESIKEYFESYFAGKILKFNVSKVNLCYDIQDIVRKIRELEKWNK